MTNNFFRLFLICFRAKKCSKRGEIKRDQEMFPQEEERRFMGNLEGAVTGYDRDMSESSDDGDDAEEEEEEEFTQEQAVGKMVGAIQHIQQAELEVPELDHLESPVKGVGGGFGGYSDSNRFLSALQEGTGPSNIELGEILERRGQGGSSNKPTSGFYGSRNLETEFLSPEKGVRGVQATIDSPEQKPGYLGMGMGSHSRNDLVPPPQYQAPDSMQHEQEDNSIAEQETFYAGMECNILPHATANVRPEPTVESEPEQESASQQQDSEVEKSESDAMDEEEIVPEETQLPLPSGDNIFGDVERHFEREEAGLVIPGEEHDSDEDGPNKNSLRKFIAKVAGADGEAAAEDDAEAEAEGLMDITTQQQVRLDDDENANNESAQDEDQDEDQGETGEVYDEEDAVTNSQPEDSANSDVRQSQNGEDSYQDDVAQPESDHGQDSNAMDQENLGGSQEEADDQQGEADDQQEDSNGEDQGQEISGEDRSDEQGCREEGDQEDEQAESMGGLDEAPEDDEHAESEQGESQMDEEHLPSEQAQDQSEPSHYQSQEQEVANSNQEDSQRNSEGNNDQSEGNNDQSGSQADGTLEHGSENPSHQSQQPESNQDSNPASQENQSDPEPSPQEPQEEANSQSRGYNQSSHQSASQHFSSNLNQNSRPLPESHQEDSRTFPHHTTTTPHNFTHTNTFSDLEPLPLQQEERFIPRRQMFSDHNLGDDDNEEHTSSGASPPQGPDSDHQIQQNLNTESQNPDLQKSVGKQMLTPVNTDLYNMKVADSLNSGFVKAEGYKDNTLRGVEGGWVRGGDGGSGGKGYGGVSSGNFFSN